MPYIGWPTEIEIADHWPQAPNDGSLTLLRAAAIAACEAYAPQAPEGEDVQISDGFKLAAIMQTRNLHNAGLVSPAGDIGGGDFVVRPRPLDWQITSLLRPRRGRPYVG